MRGVLRSLLATAALFPPGMTARSDEPARPTATAVTPDLVTNFENRVRPLLADRCVKCHGPRKQESNLRLDSRSAMMRGGDSGPAMVPGKPADSLLVKAIRHEGDLRMPPDSRLAADQVATLTRWIADGAPWPEASEGAMIRRGAISAEDRAFWSFQPIRPRPAPAVQDRGWVRTPVDRWILAELESRGLHPARRADRRTLIRRATFDLTGLPPTPEEVDAFLADDSPDAFARVVDRLLASPAYGEHWGRHWLDIVRYADTAGETADYPVPEAYRYRNGVIAAFNQDIPYDQFVREQIAGDIIAEGKSGPEYARLVTATGFLAISRRFGFDAENYQHLTIQDTIDTTGQAFLGLTLGCARCHDHKYDPVSQRDYYALYGIFESTRFAFPGSEQKPQIRTMASLRPRAETEALREQIARLEEGRGARKGDPPGVVIETLDDLDGDFEIQKPSDGGSLGTLVPPWKFEGQPAVIAVAQSPFTNLTHRVGHTGIYFPGDRDEHSIWQRLRPARTARTSRTLHVNLDFRMVSPDARATGTYQLALRHGTDGPLAIEIIIGTAGILASDGNRLRTLRAAPGGDWTNLRMVLDLERKTYSGEIGGASDLTTFTDLSFATGWDGTTDTVQLNAPDPASGLRPVLHVDNIAVREAPIRALKRQSGGSKTATPDPVDQARSLAVLNDRRAGELAYGVAEGTPGDARIHKRGEPTKPGERVPRRFLEVLGGDPLPPGAEGSGRFELAHWMTRPENPLTARVMVNRIWAWHFGVGLVATENDFGRRGRRPTLPGLLDDLADRFMAGGWSIKAMHRLIMLSATYQTSSEVDASASGADPSDEWLGRFPRRRLDAESIRDAILMLGGGLDRSPGGRHPFPPTGTKFSQHAPFGAVYPSDRRSIYLMNQRIRRHPFLSLFDGPDPNASTPRRSITTVPTQALFFINDPFVHQQAEGFARRLLASGPDERGRIRLAYRMTLAREPDDAELESTSDFLTRYRRQLGIEGVAAAEHDRLSWSALARTLFASNEFLFLD
jgi:hypothetical protein